ncbi:bifunctional GNAT family N-acetyltransferase/carbon-nitrogen hydrolase family protein [Oleiagrimonas sp. C23AA]|uniref:bifunctional GNAT family N-acetyltransferase/carbon-nitrogen hydrolase family protein n=1 Tax=Oleiagrimonas sp. C23AA TaxID=2719047 RepID=UPI00141F68B5|nr:bifunctional GNAT family N-acetyltransferase/carbon-nitrogen hydrolase family protein [Oleiagrimonas sp. C23AA]NII09246.1 GNAT family N-acetyltransferase [Oleiagrimonas sp. C23AA]
MANSKSSHPAKLVVRQAQLTDVPQLVELTAGVYSKEWGHSAEMLRGQQAHFAQGQFVAEYEGRIVGYCATFRIDESAALSPHTWTQITGGGFGSRHDPQGDWLYGMEVVVDPAYRGMRIGQRLYSARKRLCTELKLRGIVFGGRLPGLAKRRAKYKNAQDYVQAVVEGKLRDQTLSFQLRNGFEVIGLLPEYVPSDHESLGFATHLVWRNPSLHDHPDVPHVSGGPPLPNNVRLASVQYQQRRITSFDEFARQVEYFTDIAADYNADFVTFPELITLQLLSIENEELPPVQTIRKLSEWTPQVKELFSRLAVRYNINIIGGSHPTLMDDGDIHNVCYVCLRDGAIHEQEKLHPTPSERNVWNITGGDSATMIQTDCGPIGVMICYDSEFPEVARHLTDQGALILFTPFCTDVREGYLRVRYSCQARAIENQCYVVMSGNVGNLPGVNNFDIQYGQSCILTPCDFPFARDGIAADSTPNIETVLFADLSLESLARSRNNGTVQNLKDRRFDLYEMRWRRRPG